MNFLTNDLKLHLVVLLFLFGVALFISFSIIKNYIFPLLNNKQSLIKRYWQKIIISTWIIYAMVFYTLLIQANPSITLVFTIVIIGLGWNYWKNVFTGILIKLNNDYTNGETITTQNHEGTIKHIGFSHTKLINAEGELILIPNFILRSSILKKHSKKSNIQSHSFIINSGALLTSKELYAIALNCPYISGNQTIEIKKTETDRYTVKATVIDDSFVEDIERYFKEISCP